MTFDPKPYLREIARGRRGFRHLTREQAHTLFAAALAGEVDDLALGTLLAAYRIKGETAPELAGMLDATQPHVGTLRFPEGPMAVVIPTYNGSRKLPNLVPLLAALIAREGVPVLLHGAAQEPQRVGSFEILERLGHRPATELAQAQASLAQHRLAAVPIHVLAPALARLIDVRLHTGVRNSAHTLAKLLLPAGVASSRACRLVSVTHPDFQQVIAELYRDTPANVFLMRGVEGEPVVRLHAPQPIQFVGSDGEWKTHELGVGESDPQVSARDAQATAAWTREVLEGLRPAPAALAAQAALVVRICRGG